MRTGFDPVMSKARGRMDVCLPTQTRGEFGESRPVRGHTLVKSGGGYRVHSKPHEHADVNAQILASSATNRRVRSPVRAARALIALSLPRRERLNVQPRVLRAACWLTPTTHMATLCYGFGSTTEPKRSDRTHGHTVGHVGSDSSREPTDECRRGNFEQEFTE